MRSPIQWYGGKGTLCGRIVELIPEHVTYVEPFAGGASVLFAKPPSSVEVLNDINRDLMAFYQVLRDPAMFARLKELLALTPYSRDEWRDAGARMYDETDLVEKARLFFILARQTMGGFGGQSGAGWSIKITSTARGVASGVSAWLGAIEGLPAVHARLQLVQLDDRAWETCIDAYDTENTVFYLDPPYVRSERVGVVGNRRSAVYATEMDNAAHARLVDRLLNVRGYVMLSGYDNEIYRPLAAAGWRKRDWLRISDAVPRTRAIGMQGEGSGTADHIREECLWMNYRFVEEQ